MTDVELMGMTLLWRLSLTVISQQVQVYTLWWLSQHTNCQIYHLSQMSDIWVTTNIAWYLSHCRHSLIYQPPQPLSDIAVTTYIVWYLSHCRQCLISQSLHTLFDISVTTDIIGYPSLVWYLGVRYFSHWRHCLISRSLQTLFNISVTTEIVWFLSLVWYLGHHRHCPIS